MFVAPLAVEVSGTVVEVPYEGRVRHEVFVAAVAEVVLLRGILVLLKGLFRLEQAVAAAAESHIRVRERTDEVVKGGRRVED